MNPKTGQATGLFNQFISEVAQDLKPRGFSRKRNTFYKRAGQNWGLVNFQKSLSSRTDVITFTTNLAVASGTLLRFYSGRETDVAPSLERCHWRMRLGYLIDKRDVWWTVNSTTVVYDIRREICGYLVELGIPEIDKFIDDEALRDLWLAGRSAGLTNLERLKHLLVLIKSVGPAELFESTAAELEQITEGKLTSYTAKSHLDKLKVSQ